MAEVGKQQNGLYWMFHSLNYKKENLKWFERLTNDKISLGNSYLFHTFIIFKGHILHGYSFSNRTTSSNSN